MPICAICGREVENVTDDHIPPKNLFSKIPENRIVVPACLECNGGTAKDDEYFRLLASEIDTATHPQAKKPNEAIVRSLARPEAAKFRESLRQQVYGLQISESDPSQITPFLGLDVQRLDRTVNKIVKGLFYHVRGYPVPAAYKVLATNLDLFMEKPNSVELAKLIRNYLLPKCSWVTPTVIGEGVFTYQFFSEDDDPNTAFVLMMFYGRWRFFGFVMEAGFGD